MKTSIEAFWFEDSSEDGGSGYQWVCPHCSELNFIADDFSWNGKLGTHVSKYEHSCEHCESEDEHTITRK